MNIDTEHLHYWMNAVRISSDPIRTLDCFWSGQVKSKEWLIEQLKPFIEKESRIDIHGGWNGVLASLLFCSGLPIKYICSVDIDPECEPIATMMNKIEEQDARFRAVTRDMCSIPMHGDVIINTSCEHLTQEQYDTWLSRVPSNALIVVQSNDYEIDEHIRIAQTLEEFIAQSRLDNILFKGTLKLQLYTRYMIIAKKDIS